MRVHRVSRTVPYTPEQMFALVGDVERYPQFVPWVVEMQTWNLQTWETGASQVDAEAKVGFAFLKEKFATRVLRDPAENMVSVRLLSGPFRHLVNEWRFLPHDGGCEISFLIEFEFKSRFLDAMLEANFDRAVNRLIGCFEARAKALYGQEMLT